jgi:putative oxidoreductase
MPTDDRRRDLGLLILRLSGLGLAFAHGLGKLTALAGGEQRFVEGVARLGFPAPVAFAWAAALTEVVGGLLIAVGLATRVTAVLAAVVMAVAGFLRHHALEQIVAGVGLTSIAPEVLERWGKPELALVYLLCFLAIALLGPGRLSLDHALRARRGRRR